MLSMKAVMIPNESPSHQPTPLPTVEVIITMIFVTARGTLATRPLRD